MKKNKDYRAHRQHSRVYRQYAIVAVERWGNFRQSCVSQPRRQY